MSDTACRGAGNVGPHHLELEACIYTRQASPRRVPPSKDGGGGQGSLRRRATALGWPEDRIRVIVDCPAKPGSGSAGRPGFRELVASVAAGEVGIVLSRRISCLSRSIADLQRLFRAAWLTNTLILDEAGIHDPSDSRVFALLLKLDADAEEAHDPVREVQRMASENFIADFQARHEARLDALESELEAIKRRLVAAGVAGAAIVAILQLVRALAG